MRGFLSLWKEKVMLKITRAQDRHSPNLLIPAAFFLEDMPQLDELSLRAYLLILAQAQAGDRQLDDQVLADQLGVSPDRLQDSIKLLSARGLLAETPQGLELADLQDYYRQREGMVGPTAAPLWPSNPSASSATTAPAPASASHTAAPLWPNDPSASSTAPDQQASLADRPAFDQEALADLIRQLNHTFYQGVMPLSFYNSVEKWYRDYGFAPDLIYALFNEIKKYHKLQVNNYAEQVAASWREEGLRTFSDLNARHEAQEGVKHYANILERKLRLSNRLTSYQLEYLKRWLYEWDLPFDLIDEAFRRAASKQAQSNFNYVEAILKNWAEAGLRHPKEIEAYEAEFLATLQAQQSRQAGHAGHADRRGGYARKSSQAMGNFEQRQYQEEEITSLYRSLDFLKAEAEPEPRPEFASGSGSQVRSGSEFSSGSKSDSQPWSDSPGRNVERVD